MVERNWKKYYTREELEKKIDSQIELRAEKLFDNLRKSKKVVNTKKVSYV